jgi:hypothetical protein
MRASATRSPWTGVGHGLDCGDQRRDRSHHPPEADRVRDHRTEAALQTARSAHANQPPHHQAKIEPAGVDQHALQNIDMPTQMRSAHAGGVVDVGKAAFDPLAAVS